MSFGTRSRRNDEPAHWPLHVFVLLMVLVTIYPILWVLTIAFSGGQSLAIADVPAERHVARPAARHHSLARALLDSTTSARCSRTSRSRAGCSTASSWRR